MSALENLLEYYPLSLAAQKLNRDEIELLLLGHAGQITFHQYPDPTLGLIEWEPVHAFDIGAIIIQGTKTGRSHQSITADFDTEKTDLVLTKAEMERAHRLLNPSLYTDRLATATDEKTVSAESTKTVNYLATALKAFIHIHYGADVADNLRKHLEDPSSPIRTDFANKEIKAPGGKALARHLKTILIEVIPAIENVDVESDAGNT